MYKLIGLNAYNLSLYNLSESSGQRASGGRAQCKPGSIAHAVFVTDEEDEEELGILVVGCCMFGLSFNNKQKSEQMLQISWYFVKALS